MVVVIVGLHVDPVAEVPPGDDAGAVGEGNDRARQLARPQVGGTDHEHHR